MNENPTPAFGDDDALADAETGAMKRALQQDVASWTAGRVDAPNQSLALPRSLARARASTAKPATPAAAKVAPIAMPAAPRKPYAMKYDGRPAKSYVAERYRDGAR